MLENEVKKEVILMNREKHICPGCKVIEGREHKCHSDQFGYCDCPDCREPGIGGMADWGDRSCDCKVCADKKMIRRFQETFSEEDKELIYKLLKLKYKDLPI